MPAVGGRQAAGRRTALDGGGEIVVGAARDAGLHQIARAQHQVGGVLAQGQEDAAIDLGGLAGVATGRTNSLSSDSPSTSTSINVPRRARWCFYLPGAGCAKARDGAARLPLAGTTSVRAPDGVPSSCE